MLANNVSHVCDKGMKAEVWNEERGGFIIKFKRHIFTTALFLIPFVGVLVLTH